MKGSQHPAIATYLEGVGVVDLVGITKIGVQAKSVAVISASNGVRQVHTSVVVTPADWFLATLSYLVDIKGQSVLKG